MYRLNILKGVPAAAGALFAASGARASTGKPDKMKVAYHLSDLDKAGFVVGNIQNHFDGGGGPEVVSIVLVVNGPALKAFHSPSSNSELRQKVAKLNKNGLALEA